VRKPVSVVTNADAPWSGPRIEIERVVQIVVEKPDSSTGFDQQA